MKQQYADFHFHTDFSPDSTAPMEAQILAAQKRGVQFLCPTDHWDLVDEENPKLKPPLSLWQSHLWGLKEKYQETQDFSLFFGVEIGEGYVRPDLVQAAIDGLPLDFILASVHAVKSTDFAQGIGIFYALQGETSHQAFLQFFQEYFAALLRQSQETFYDSFGHINYPFRYLPPDSLIKIENYEEEIRAVLENLLKNDKVFEVNTTRGQTVTDWIPILKWYQDLGGKYVTIGSDAHQTKDMSTGIVEAVALLKSLGFSSYVYYEKRQRKEIPIL
ncbi:MAG: histidinol-phosphatase HisJ family protein [Eubacteriales bacterium]